MLAKTLSAVQTGFESSVVEVECDTANSLPGIIIVGLGTKAIDEAKERIRGAIKNSDLNLPAKRFTLNLAPADIPKDGTGLDLAMAMALLVASRQVDQHKIKGMAFCGELSLDGSIKPINGMLAHVKALGKADVSTVVVCTANASEAALIKDVKILVADNLKDLYRHAIDEIKLNLQPPTLVQKRQPFEVDLRDIAHQFQAKRALEIAAAGGHNILMNGPPGSGKTMLAKAFISILPPLTHEEMLDVTLIHSLAGEHHFNVVTKRPFRNPHHTTSNIALVGGGRQPKPGEVSLSNHGVLFLDELPEYNRSAIESLRQPIEDGVITISRVNSRSEYPANFTLIATQNPCPCGYATDTEIACSCSAAQIQRYTSKVSGPLLDRFDIILEVGRIPNATLLAENSHLDVTSDIVADRVIQARALQAQRFGTTTKLNCRLSNKEIKQLQLKETAKKLLDSAAEQLKLSARGYMRTIKVAQTIADLAEQPAITDQHIAEALQYRIKVHTQL